MPGKDGKLSPFEQALTPRRDSDVEKIARLTAERDAALGKAADAERRANDQEGKWRDEILAAREARDRADLKVEALSELRSKCDMMRVCEHEVGPDCGHCDPCIDVVYKAMDVLDDADSLRANEKSTQGDGPGCPTHTRDPHPTCLPCMEANPVACPRMAPSRYGKPCGLGEVHAGPCEFNPICQKCGMPGDMVVPGGETIKHRCN